MKTFLSLLFLMSLLQGDTLEGIIEYSLNHHGSLKSIQERLSAVENEKNRARNFSNPDISFTVSDIQFDNPSDRTLEPMQFSAVNIKQKIPYFGKRDAQEQKVDSKKRFLDMSLENLRSELKKEIRITAYSLWDVQKQLGILDSYINITNQNIALDEAYNITSSNTHLALMSAKLALSDLMIKKSSLQTLKNSLYEKLSYLAGRKVKTLDISLSVDKPQNLTFYENRVLDSSALHVRDAEVEIQKADLHIKELAEKIDPYIQAGYYYRENHPDYATVTVGASLPLYGSEKESREEARKLLLAKSSQRNDLKEKLVSRIAQLYENLQKNYKVYKIITDQSMPQIEHLFELVDSSVKSGDTLFEYIDMLGKKLKLEEQLIQVTAEFNKTKASLDALTGE
ncbi:TolC family protein [Sulfurimonas sp. HSL-1716]|uniref:TolC family protein n=1 Tax=Hydrocurvibacter sulfurireducens TaxID=3131937 RepID=UPI0031F9FEC1